MRQTRIVLSLIALFLFGLFSTTTLAHSGKTDGQGGHTDHSTGNYHYHHGYPAHSHYDMDGDGATDCPYYFDNKTGLRSGSESSEETTTIQRPISKPAGTTATNQAAEDKTVPIWTRWLLIILVLIVVWLAIMIKEKNEEIARQKKIHNEETQKENIIIQNLVEDIEKATDRDILHFLAHAPVGDRMGDDMLPLNVDEYVDKKFRWGAKYTFYSTGTTSKYHRVGCRYCSSSVPTNAYIIRKRRYTPCQICLPKLPDVDWVDRYIKYKTFFERKEIKIKTVVKKRG